MKLIAGTIERKILLVIFISAVTYFIVFLLVSGYSPNPLGLYTQIPLFIMPILTGFLGLRQARSWGGIKSVMGKAMLGLSLSEVVFGTGFLIWTYYLFTGIELPYPSLADYVFVWFTPVWSYGLFQLSRVIGVPLGLRVLKKGFRAKILFLGVIFVVSLLSYYLLTLVAQVSTPYTGENTPQLIFNLIYNYETLIHIVIIAAVYNLSRNYLGGLYKAPVLTIFIGFIIHYVAILFFTYGTTTLTYFNGNIADIFFTIAIYLECLGILNLDARKVANE